MSVMVKVVAYSYLEKTFSKNSDTSTKTSDILTCIHDKTSPL